MIHFVAYSTTSQNIEAKANYLGLIVGAAGPVTKSNWDSRPAVAGKTYPIKDALRAAGARWDGLAKAWAFQDMAQLEAALNSIAEVN